MSGNKSKICSGIITLLALSKTKSLSSAESMQTYSVVKL
jgi:hypothetical protein